ncbi:pyridoxamine 5'-phosphate oxidase family protein [Flexivirga caeni]|uniref:pyridoxamine 5'-phosphate oxidase family protein n=1 Tax=Flexivirga caeni TaxID=2294115 RepID=UPI0011CE8102|nr:pyridoxamine 5'-phosphate oxidase family protein [Flexivirga caeni]
MSIAVDPDALAETVAGFGSAHVLSTDGTKVRTVCADVTLAEGVFHVPRSRHTALNVESHPAITLLFPPTEHHGYSLIVDGDAQDTGTELLLAPTSAVLHRPAAHADGPVAPGGCEDDCRHL